MVDLSTTVTGCSGIVALVALTETVFLCNLKLSLGGGFSVFIIIFGGHGVHWCQKFTNTPIEFPTASDCHDYGFAAFCGICKSSTLFSTRDATAHTQMAAQARKK